MVTYETIAAQFDAVSDNAWILTGYNLGYCVALPVVRQHLHRQFTDRIRHLLTFLTRKYGKFSDTYGQKTPLAVSYCLFSIGILLSYVEFLLP